MATLWLRRSFSNPEYRQRIRIQTSVQTHIVRYLAIEFTARPVAAPSSWSVDRILGRTESDR